jgi:hypothetical protein
LYECRGFKKSQVILQFAMLGIDFDNEAWLNSR